MKKNLNVQTNKQQEYVGFLHLFLKKRVKISYNTSSDFDNIINLLWYPTK